MSNGQVTFEEHFHPDFVKGLQKIQEESEKAFNNFKKMTIELNTLSNSIKTNVSSNKELLKIQNEIIVKEQKNEVLKQKLLVTEQKIIDLQNKIVISNNKRLKSEFDAESSLNKAIKTETQLQKTIENTNKSIDKSSVAWQRNNAIMKENEKTARLHGVMIAAAENSEKRYAATIDYLTHKKSLLTQGTIEGDKRIKQYNKAIDDLKNKLHATGSTLQQQQRNIGNYNGQWNAMRNSINQLSREAPAFANSMNTGFMAISNNIPALSDAIGQLREQNKQLAAEGKPTVSVLKSLAGAVFSWQTALSVGITLLTVYGADLIEFITSTKKVTDGLDSMKTSIQDLSEKILEAKKNKSTIGDYFSKDQTKAEQLQSTIEDIKKSMSSIQSTKGGAGGIVNIDILKSFSRETIQAWIDGLQDLPEILIGRFTKEQLQSYLLLKDALILKEQELQKELEKVRQDESKKQDDKRIQDLENKKAYLQEVVNIRKEFGLEEFLQIQEIEKKISNLRGDSTTEYLTLLAQQQQAFNEFVNNIGGDNLKSFNRKTKIGENKSHQLLSTPTSITDYGVNPRASVFSRIESGDNLLDALGLTKPQIAAVKSGYEQLYSIASEYTDKMVQLAEKKNEAAKQEVENKQNALNNLYEAQRNGEKVNLTFAKNELEQAKKLQKQAEVEEKKALRRQLAIQSIEQASNLLSASAKLIADTGGNPLLYAPLLTLMWGTFAASKTKAFKETKFAKGGYRIIQGGTHASGNDTYIGNNGDEKMFAEQGEAMMVFNRNATTKYKDILPGLFNAINKGQLDIRGRGKKGSATVINFSTTKLENSVNKLVNLQQEKTYFENGKKIVKVGNITKVYV